MSEISLGQFDSGILDKQLRQMKQQLKLQSKLIEELKAQVDWNDKRVEELKAQVGLSKEWA